MKKKSELTEAEMFFIINSNESDEVVAKKVDCSKRVVTGIRAANPAHKENESDQEENESLFLKSIKSTVNDGKTNVFVMTQGASEMVDDMTKLSGTNTNKTPDTSTFVTKIFKK